MQRFELGKVLATRHALGAPATTAAREAAEAETHKASKRERLYEAPTGGCLCALARACTAPSSHSSIP